MCSCPWVQSVGRKSSFSTSECNPSLMAHQDFSDWEHQQLPESLNNFFPAWRMAHQDFSDFERLKEPPRQKLLFPTWTLFKKFAFCWRQPRNLKRFIPLILKKRGENPYPAAVREVPLPLSPSIRHPDQQTRHKDHCPSLHHSRVRSCSALVLCSLLILIPGLVFLPSYSELMSFHRDFQILESQVWVEFVSKFACQRRGNALPWCSEVSVGGGIPVHDDSKE